MLKKSFTLASAVSLTGAVVWMASTTACGGSESSVGSSSSSSGSASSSGASSSGASSSGNASSSSSSSSGASSSGLVDPTTVDGVSITYGKCADFAKCDGSVEGSFNVTGGCLSDTTFDQFRKFCPGLKEHDVVIKASGTVDATADQITRKTSIFLSAQFDVPKACTALLGGTCDGIPGALTSGAAGAAFDHAVCDDAGDLCKCKGDATVKEAGTPTDYKTDGTGVLTTQNPTRTFDYCPKGNVITYQETTKDNKTFSMFLEITKK